MLRVVSEDARVVHDREAGIMHSLGEGFLVPRASSVHAVGEEAVRRHPKLATVREHPQRRAALARVLGPVCDLHARAAAVDEAHVVGAVLQGARVDRPRVVLKHRSVAVPQEHLQRKPVVRSLLATVQNLDVVVMQHKVAVRSDELAELLQHGANDAFAVRVVVLLQHEVAVAVVVIEELLIRVLRCRAQACGREEEDGRLGLLLGRHELLCVIEKGPNQLLHRVRGILLQQRADAWLLLVPLALADVGLPVVDEVQLEQLSAVSDGAAAASWHVVVAAPLVDVDSASRAAEVAHDAVVQLACDDGRESLLLRLLHLPGNLDTLWLHSDHAQQLDHEDDHKYDP
mmetsp:Transcript_15931/g.62258  ORF Transcript_15931/g.62258 Transcript_15931/m.62258 type:complete len:344 (+) Transcript_15931:527-1558(+)